MHDEIELSYCKAPDDFYIAGEQDLNDLLGLCYEFPALLLHAGNLSPAFFDVSSGLAGAVMQKLANYHVRTAIVMSMDLGSTLFPEVALEANRGSLVHFFSSDEDAVYWLTQSASM